MHVLSERWITFSQVPYFLTQQRSLLSTCIIIECSCLFDFHFRIYSRKLHSRANLMRWWHRLVYKIFRCRHKLLVLKNSFSAPGLKLHPSKNSFGCLISSVTRNAETVDVCWNKQLPRLQSSGEVPSL